LQLDIFHGHSITSTPRCAARWCLGALRGETHVDSNGGITRWSARPRAIRKSGSTELQRIRRRQAQATGVAAPPNSLSSDDAL